MFTFFYPGCSYGFTQNEWIGGSGRKQHQAHHKRKVHGKSRIFAMVKDACGTCKSLLLLLCISRDSWFAGKSQMALNLRFRAGKSHGKSGKPVSRCFFPSLHLDLRTSNKGSNFLQHSTSSGWAFVENPTRISLCGDWFPESFLNQHHIKN